MAQTGTEMNRYVVALTGASGMIYAQELLAYFAGRPDLELHAVISAVGEQVLALELGLTPGELAPGAHWHRVDDLTAPLASGSFKARAMVVVPCSMGTLGAIAQGAGRNLIHRAGDVFLKERRSLILVVR
ncbi:MAG: UbiX family flavin prenyltransferase, partial [Desulfobaccales bacterium]